MANVIRCLEADQLSPGKKPDRVPIVAISGSKIPGGVPVQPGVGIDVFLSKPIKLAELSAALSALGNVT